MSCSDFPKVHFVGLLGVGMSALAQFLAMQKVLVQGSDRSSNGVGQTVQDALAELDVACFPQDGSAVAAAEWVVISTAIEEDNLDLIEARRLNKVVLHRSELLRKITERYKTIAISGTSGKSTTAAMVFTTLFHAGLRPNLITGAGLTLLQEKGYLGNAWAGEGDYLVIEADESDGTLIEYHPEIGVCLNLDKDHKELHELATMFQIFRKQSQHFITNASSEKVRALSTNQINDFGFDSNCGCSGKNSKALEWGVSFAYNEQEVTLTVPGVHNAENALAALAVAKKMEIDTTLAISSLEKYKGISRRHQLLATHKDIRLVDDFAHNPAKIAASIRSCQQEEGRVLAWWQPHGFGPTKFLRKELVEEITSALRVQDEIHMSEIYYAGGTASKDISAEDLINDLQSARQKAFFCLKREESALQLIQKAKAGDTILLMGARDPSLELFAKDVQNLLTKA